MMNAPVDKVKKKNCCGWCRVSFCLLSSWLRYVTAHLTAAVFS